MLDIQREQMISLTEATKRLPGRPAVSTVRRWTGGIRGVVLETALIGGKRYTSIEALQRFVNALSTPKTPATLSPSRSMRGSDREATISESLDELGI